MGVFSMKLLNNVERFNDAEFDHVLPWTESEYYKIANKSGDTFNCVYTEKNGRKTIRLPGIKKGFSLSELKAQGWFVAKPTQERLKSRDEI